MEWEKIKSNLGTMYRVSVPGGWLVSVWKPEGVGLTFYPDPGHMWDGRSE
jgi:hypothetical protein